MVKSDVRVMIFHMRCAVTLFFNLRCILVKEADTATQNTSTTLNTIGMHTDVLHILNNDHIFGISNTPIL
jgi:hypothetical protein